MKVIFSHIVICNFSYILHCKNPLVLLTLIPYTASTGITIKKALIIMALFAWLLSLLETIFQHYVHFCN